MATIDEGERAGVAGSGHRAVFEAACVAIAAGDAACLALVLETDGSTYVSTGAMALFGASTGQVGWLSGGCLEPEIERVALQAGRDGTMAWMEVDTRDDEDLLAGSALGCRGRLRIALLPLRALVGIERALSAWLDGRVAVDLSIGTGGEVRCDAIGDVAQAAPDGLLQDCPPYAWSLPGPTPPWATPRPQWSLHVAPPPALLVFGAGPETPTLLPLLRALGWRSSLVERRSRWIGHARHADVLLDVAPADALHDDYAAALVMHHNFELDREALDALAAARVPFVGLLGPVRRREDLFRVLPGAHRDAFVGRLHSPVGIRLGGQGPEAIALSIAAQLQAWRTGELEASDPLPFAHD